MIRKYQLLFLFFTACFLGACNKFLDVKPEDKVEEGVLLKDEKGFQQHLNGIYLTLGSQSLYGGPLSMELVEVMAQQYTCLTLSGEQHAFYLLGVDYNYEKDPFLSKSASMWASMYNTIANVNTLIGNIDAKKDVFQGNNYYLAKGEAFALRAFLHFDMLRFYGPVYSVDSTATSIPYYGKQTLFATPILPANEVMAHIVDDLAQAELLLNVDPIITKGVNGDKSGGDYSTARNLRFNYYAVKMLQARVLLYRGDKTGALAAAKIVIDKQPAYFPFVDRNVVMNTKNPDRIFCSELVLAFQNGKLENSYKAYYSPELSDVNILAPRQEQLDALFENSASDYRYIGTMWNVPGNGKDFKCFYKYANLADVLERRGYIPAFRVSEACLIAAECSDILTEKFKYLEMVRAARGLVSLTGSPNFDTELTKEYRKEFIGEGQLFYYYKRKNMSTIPNGSSQFPSATITMTTARYKPALPKNETDNRR